MAKYPLNSEILKTGFYNPFFLACLLAFLALAASPVNSMAINIVANTSIETSENSFLNQNVITNLLNTNRKIYQPYDDTIIFSDNIYAIKKYKLLSAITAIIEFDKRKTIIGFAVIDTLKLPLIRQKKWNFHVSGKINAPQQYAVFPYQRNRWNFEHQFGFGVNYQIKKIFQLSVGAYHYRIINNFLYVNPEQSYIKSGGGFATLRFEF